LEDLFEENTEVLLGCGFGVNLKDFPVLMFFCARKNIINYAGKC
jgi:hypothetical protein